MMVATFHPAASLIVWLFFIVALSGAQGPALLLAAACWLAVPGAWRAVLQAVVRMRFLLPALVLLSGWFVPGEPCWAGQAWSPSQAGLQLGGEQALRLLVMAASVRLLWQAYGQAGFLAGLRVLLAPLAMTGVPVSRFCLRLVLTLQQAERLLQVRPRLSLSWLAGELQADQGSQTLPDKVELGFYSWQYRDAVLVCVACLVLIIIMKVVQ
ncbi:hypothetical protein PQU95_11350 [Vogesella sp. DC21W]|uniref:Cobalt transporter n=1 Tax=Vogesella aquatica TaxID=2984206 RepID=A0ABT5IZ00_9NEIS|nr:hypothetical protein [Vogesella aquatica]MDC7717806.1 hypothetical protein [Vogesella aquatica]